MPALAVDDKIVFNYSKQYKKDFPGDDTYLEDKFVRFGYRFKYVDDEYSLFSTFTQSAFIPRQDGYFLYVNDETRGMPELDDQGDHSLFRLDLETWFRRISNRELIHPIQYQYQTIQL